MERSELKPGMTILFGRTNGEQTRGEVVSVLTPYHAFLRRAV